MVEDKGDEFIRRCETKKNPKKRTKSWEADKHDHNPTEIQAKKLSDGFKNFVLF
jgi:hypothetical protein